MPRDAQWPVLAIVPKTPRQLPVEDCIPSAVQEHRVFAGTVQEMGEADAEGRSGRQIALGKHRNQTNSGARRSLE